MKKKYHFYLESKKRIIEFLNKYEVPYETHTTISLNDRMEKVTEDMCVFDLYGDDDTSGTPKVLLPDEIVAMITSEA